jgi:hypothetical protein
MSVDSISGVAGLKFMAYFAPFMNVTYCLSEDLPFGRSGHFVTSWRRVQPHRKTSMENWRIVVAVLNLMVHVVEVLVFHYRAHP